MTDRETIAADFDQIALCAPEHDGFWNHNNHYHPDMLAALPGKMRLAVDVGCGAGELSRKLAERAERVIGVDISTQMLIAARERSAAYGNIIYIEDDIFNLDIPDGSADAIVAVAVAHHLPFAQFLRWARRKLAVGGVLYIIDINQAQTLADYITGAAAFIPNKFREAAKRRAKRKAGLPPRRTAAGQYVWAEHGEHEEYMTLSAVRAAAEGELPSAKVKRRLYFRYTLLWQA